MSVLRKKISLNIKKNKCISKLRDYSMLPYLLFNTTKRDYVSWVLKILFWRSSLNYFGPPVPAGFVLLMPFSVVRLSKQLNQEWRWFRIMGTTKLQIYTDVQKFIWLEFYVFEIIITVNVCEIKLYFLKVW